MHHAVALKLRLGMKHGLLVSHTPRVGQQRPLVAAQIGIDALDRKSVV